MAAGPLLGRPPKAPTGLSIAAQILLAVGAFASLGTIIGCIMRLSSLNSTGSLGSSASFVIGFSTVLFLPTFIAGIVVFIVWCFRVRANSDVIAPQIRRLYPRGWAIAGWFVPIGWFWIPRYVVGDVWTASQPLGSDPRRSSTGSPLLNSWWICWCGFWVVDIVSLIADGTASVDTNGTVTQSTSSLKTITLLSLASCVLRLAAGLLALFVVRKITAFQQIRILQGPGEGHPYAAPALGYPQPLGYYPQPPYPQQQPFAPAPTGYPPYGYPAPQPYQPSVPPQLAAPAPVPALPADPPPAPAPPPAPEPLAPPAVDLGKTTD